MKFARVTLFKYLYEDFQTLNEIVRESETMEQLKLREPEQNVSKWHALRDQITK